MTDGDRQAFLTLFDRLARMLYATVSHGWDSGFGPKAFCFKASLEEHLPDGKPGMDIINQRAKAFWQHASATSGTGEAAQS